MSDSQQPHGLQPTRLFRPGDIPGKSTGVGCHCFLRTCSIGDPNLIPGWGSSLRKGIDYPLQYSRPSLEAQTVKNPPVMQEIWVWSLGWEDPLEEGMATHSHILAWRIPWTEEPGRLQPMGSQRVGHN